MPIAAATLCWSQSFYPMRPDDPKAVYLEASEGTSDLSAALQNAIDRVQETAHHGIVFVPEGRYRLEHTVHVWAGIRLVGYGAKRRAQIVRHRISEGFEFRVGLFTFVNT